MAYNNTPIGVAQKKVLDALNLTATDWTDAQRIFEASGIEVTSKRVGRSSEPVVRMMETTISGWNAGGDGESYEREFAKIDLTAIAQWITK